MDLAAPWPPILGMNRVVARTGDDTQLLALAEHYGRRHPLLATRSYGSGRTLAWTTDIGSHWLSRPFLNWDGYDTLITNMVRWIAKEL